MFAPETGVPEDPATGSATGPLAAFMMRRGLLPLENGLRMVSEQGTKMGRRSLLHVLVHIDGTSDPVIEVGGSVVPIATGAMTV
jgi:trans-2,3-dihydro-3-hydroxyanthranilate isomerase